MPARDTIHNILLRLRHWSVIVYHWAGRSVWRWLLVLGAAGTVMGSCVIGLWVLYLATQLPEIGNLEEYKPSSITRIHDVKGNLVGEYYSERRVYVPLDQMPEELIQALLAVEDSRFYEHWGVDPVRILGAMLRNIKSGGFSQGGSTITQQLARTLFLSREKKIDRKIKEALIAFKMERQLTKSKILELYLNEIYLGTGAYGVQSASRVYFGKDVHDITLPEAAFLAGLPKAPSRYTPFVNPEAAKKRQGVVLRRMVDEGFIDLTRYQVAYATDLTFQRPKRAAREAPYFLEEIRIHLGERYGDDSVYQGGLSVYTTLDARMQEAADRAVKNGLRALDKRQGWRGVLGKVTEEELEELRSRAPGARIRTELERGTIYRAVVTGVTPDGVTVLVEGREGPIAKEDMQWARRRLTGPRIDEDVKESQSFDHQKYLEVGSVIHVGVRKVGEMPQFTLEQVPVAQGALVALDTATGEIRAMVGGYDFSLSQFNRAMDAKRQSGSAFKPIVYAAAFEQGYNPSSIVMDTPLTFRDDENDMTWKPENYEKTFKGTISLREAMIHSRNIASVKLLQELGVKPATKFARRVGITSDLAPDLSLVLGSSSVSVLELTRAYAVFASGGMLSEPYMIRKVVGPEEELMESREPVSERVISEETAFLITNVLQDVIKRGTGQRARRLRRHLGGKTGTTNDFTDAWFVGMAPGLAVGVWVGMDDHTTLGKRETGAKAALPIWIEFMRTALRRLSDETFPVPHGITYVKVDPETGKAVEKGEDGVVVPVPRAHKPEKAASEAPDFETFVELDMAGGQG